MWKKVFFVFLSVLLCACHSKETKVVFETEGIEYTVADSVSFYYPKGFNIDTNSENIVSVNLLRDDEVLKYEMIVYDTDNAVEDMPQLYLGQLEEDGAIEADYSFVVLENELQCYEFSGIYVSGMKFKHIVYFGSGAAYTYEYQATEKLYDKNISIITQYLRTLTVHNEQVS